MRLVKRRPDQIVHGRIHHHEFLGRRLLPVEHAREQHAGRADDGAARLDHHRQAVALILSRSFRMNPRISGAWSDASVRHAKPAAQVDFANVVSGVAQPLDQRQHLIHGLQNRIGIQHLRADVAAYAAQVEMRRADRARS